MTIDQLIQLMRTCSLAQVRAELARYQKSYPFNYEILICFYAAASKRKP